MSWWGRVKNTANFYEPAKTRICALSGVERASAHSFLDDHADLFQSVIQEGVSSDLGLIMVANYILTNELNQEPHSSPLLQKYDTTFRPKYNQLFICYKILNQERADFIELLEAVESDQNVWRKIRSIY